MRDNNTQKGSVILTQVQPIVQVSDILPVAVKKLGAATTIFANAGFCCLAVRYGTNPRGYIGVPTVEPRVCLIPSSVRTSLCQFYIDQ